MLDFINISLLKGRITSLFIKLLVKNKFINFKIELF